MRRHIGIVGAGIAGLHLALYLQKHGVAATLITDRRPEDYRDSRLINTVAHHHVTIAREDYLGVNHWNDPKQHYYYHDHFFNFPAAAQLSRRLFAGRAAPSITGSICRR